MKIPRFLSGDQFFLLFFAFIGSITGLEIIKTAAKTEAWLLAGAGITVISVVYAGTFGAYNPIARRMMETIETQAQALRNFAKASEDEPPLEKLPVQKKTEKTRDEHSVTLPSYSLPLIQRVGETGLYYGD